MSGAATTRESLEQRVLAELERGADALAELVATTVRTPSVTGRERPLAEFLASFLADEGLAVETKRIDEATAARHPALWKDTELDSRPNVFATWHSASAQRPPLVLNGHIDVVPPGDPEPWIYEPEAGKRADGYIWGRGASDMKGPLCAGVFALRALRAAGVELDCDVQLQCVVGEEAGGIGTLSAIETEPRPAAAIVLEPTECRVASACGGAVIFQVETRGKPAHTGLSWLGVSAMEKLWIVYEALAHLADERQVRSSHPLFDELPNGAPFGVGTFSAGEWIAMIPAQASMAGRLGVLPGESLGDVREELLSAVRRACYGDPWLRDHPAVVSWPNDGFAAWETSLSDPHVRALLSAAEDVTGAAQPAGMTFASDAGHFATAGIPAVLFGPGSITRAHLVDEYIGEEELVTGAKVLALAILRYGAR
jgi:acetylornithine deacetylase